MSHTDSSDVQQEKHMYSFLWRGGPTEIKDPITSSYFR